jgi:hypothetical protein
MEYFSVHTRMVDDLCLERLFLEHNSGLISMKYIDYIDAIPTETTVFSGLSPEKVMSIATKMLFFAYGKMSEDERKKYKEAVTSLVSVLF